MIIPLEGKDDEIPILFIGIETTGRTPGVPCPKEKCTGRWYPEKPVVEIGELVNGVCNKCGEFRVEVRRYDPLEAPYK